MQYEGIADERERYDMENNMKKLKEFNLRNLKLSFYFAYERYNIYVKKQLNYIYKNYNDCQSYKYQFWLLQKHLKKNMYYNQDNIPWR